MLDFNCEFVRVFAGLSLASVALVGFYLIMKYVGGVWLNWLLGWWVGWNVSL